MKAANKDKFDEELNIVADFYKDDINLTRNNSKCCYRFSQATFLVSLLTSHILSSSIYKDCLHHRGYYYLKYICVFAALILVMPATNAISERLFSALRRIKSYLRASMSQERLNHIMVLYVHKHLNSPDLLY